MKSREANESSKNHGSNKRSRKHPERTPSHLNGPETNGNHDDKVIDSSKGMKKSCLRRLCSS
jgi:hypothetical protein